MSVLLHPFPSLVTTSRNLILGSWDVGILGFHDSGPQHFRTSDPPIDRSQDLGPRGSRDSGTPTLRIQGSDPPETRVSGVSTCSGLELHIGYA